MAFSSPAAGTHSHSFCANFPLGPRDIRTFTLHSGDFQDEISCGLSAVSSDDENLSYEAISYVWCDPAVTKPIICNDVVIQVTTNLESPLRHIRRKDEARVLWADAVWINQGDVSEKNHQVGFMKYVFEKCSKGLVWLGPADSEPHRRPDESQS